MKVITAPRQKARKIIGATMLLFLTTCTSPSKYHSICYVFGWNVVIHCLPEDERTMSR